MDRLEEYPHGGVTSDCVLTTYSWSSLDSLDRSWYNRIQ